MWGGHCASVLLGGMSWSTHSLDQQVPLPSVHLHLATVSKHTLLLCWLCCLSSQSQGQGPGIGLLEHSHLPSLVIVQNRETCSSAAITSKANPIEGFGMLSIWGYQPSGHRKRWSLFNYLIQETNQMGFIFVDYVVCMIDLK